MNIKTIVAVASLGAVAGAGTLYAADSSPDSQTEITAIRLYNRPTRDGGMVPAVEVCGRRGYESADGGFVRETSGCVSDYVPPYINVPTPEFTRFWNEKKGIK